MFSYSSIRTYQDALKSGDTNCEKAVRFYLERIQQENVHLNAFLEIYSEEALLRAQELDRSRTDGQPMGRLHGVIIGLKDVIHYKDHALTAASKILENYTAVYNATAVEKLLAEGAIIIGRQNCDEFAMGSSSENSAFGNVRNFQDTSRVPGGSSGGSAVAVQANMCMVSLGSDTGGSVRQPADFCGIVGLKPSYGRVSRYGLIAYASSFDQIGVFAHNIEDAALVLSVIAGEDVYDSTVSDKAVPDYTSELSKEKNKKFKFAYFKQVLENPSLDPEIKASIRQTVKKLIEEGHTVDAIDFSYLDYIVPTYYILTTAEASSNLSRFDGVRFGHRTHEKVDLTDFYKLSRSEGFGKEVQKRILLGTFVLSAGYFDAYFTKAQKVRKLLVDQMTHIFSSYDAMLSPTVTAPAFKFGEKSTDPLEMYLSDIYTVFANLTGIPGISVPLYKHSNGMPFGLQVLTAPFEETTLLRISDYLMSMNHDVVM